MPITLLAEMLESPSSRRAWVEIACQASKAGRLGVALLAEGVGRNKERREILCESIWMSPSSRRAWVEIGRHGSGSGYPQVALLAEGVGRNPEGR